MTKRSTSNKSARPAPQMIRPVLEALEERCCPSVVTVTNSNDLVNGDTSSIAALLDDAGDDGISLREAVEAANNTAGDDTIDFDSSVLSILLGGSQLVLSDTTGSITIDGPGVTIDGDGLSRVFQIDAGVTAFISGLTITGGNADQGGGIWNAGELTLTSCTIEGNTAEGLDASGGGVFNNGTLTLTNSIVRDNMADGSGGGIYSAPAGSAKGSATLDMTGTTIEGNTAGKGAGLFNAGIATLDDCTITGNHAIGGLVYDSADPPAVTDIAGVGGGVFNGGTLNVTNSSVSGNTADFAGGGVMNGAPQGAAKGSTPSAATLTMTGSAIDGNTAGKGAGLWNSGTATLDDTTLNGNHAVGGPTYDTVTSGGSKGSTTTSTAVVDVNGVGGGALNSGTLTLTGSTISGNTADLGGGGIINVGEPQGSGKSSAATAATLSMTDCTVTGNSAGVGAGVLNGGQVSTGSGGSKGSTTSASTSTLEMTNCTVSDNLALPGGGTAGPSVAGAGFGVVNFGTATLIGCTITGNEGGGVYNGGDFEVAAASGGSKGSSGGGKGATTSTAATLTMSNTTISGNKAPEGPGITVADIAGYGVVNLGTATLVNCTITGQDGGGIYNLSVGGSSGGSKGSTTTTTAALSMTNCTISGNHGAAGGVYGLVNLGTATLIHCTISDNDAGIYSTASAGGGKGSSGGSKGSSTTTSVTLQNTIVAGNTYADLDGTGYAGSNNLIGTLGSGGLVDDTDGNIVGVATADLHLGPLALNGGPTQTMALLSGSPAIDAGAAVVLTTLMTAADDTIETIEVASTAGLGAGMYILIDSEIMLITGVTDGTKITVVRGQLGTTAAAHSTTGVEVTLAADQTGTGYVSSPDIGAYEYTDAFQVTVEVAPASVREDESVDLVYTFTRDGDLTDPFTIYFTVGGTAVFSSGDYTQSGAASFSDTFGTVTFAAGSATATVTITPSSDALAEGDETVILTVSSNARYDAGSPDSATGTITDPVADLQISKSDGLTNAQPGDTITYTILVTNAGPSDVSGARIQDTFPTGFLENISYTSSVLGGTVTGNGSGSPATGIDELINMSAGSSVLYTVTATVMAGAQGTLSNTATITLPADGTTDPDETNNTSTDTTNLNALPVIDAQTFTVVENSANGTVVGSVAASDPGQTLTYAILAGNIGGAFVIDAATGQLKVANSAALDFETTPTFTLTVQVTDNGTPALSSTAAITIELKDVPYTATGADAGAGPHVKVFEGNTLRFSFFAYGPGFRGGVRVALGDVNHDGVDDIITGAGPGAGPHVKVFDGRTGREIRSFYAFGVGFAGGVYVAAADLNNDGYADIITGAGPGAGPHVKVFNGMTGAVMRSFYAYGSGFAGGVFVAAGDVDFDGTPDIITGAGPGAGPHVKVFSGASGAEIRSFFAYGTGFAGGVFVAAGDIDGDDHADIITGAGPGAGPHVKVFDGRTGALVHSFFAYSPQFAGGVRVGSVDFDLDGKADIYTGVGPGAGPHVKVFKGTNLALLQSILAYGPQFRGGVFVAGGGPAGSPLQLDSAAIAPSAQVANLSASELQSTVAEALQIFAAHGVDPLLIDRLSKLTWQISDLSGSTLGMAYANRIVIDRNAAGYGWSLGDTVAPDEADLLTAVLHELGHELGLPHTDTGFLAATLGLGERRLPTQDELDKLLSSLE